jgi:hypothetical protein
MTLIEVIDLARNLLNEPLDSSRTFPDNSSNYFTDQVLMNYFNQTQQEIAETIRQSFEHYFVTSTTVDIVADQGEYTLNSAVMKIVRVEWISPDPLAPTEIFPITFNEKDNYQGLNATISGAGEVRVYSIVGDSLSLRPLPERNINSAVRYWFDKKLTDLTAGSAISQIPPAYHEVLAWGIVKKALFQQEALGDSIVVANNEFNRLKQEIQVWAEDRQIQRPRTVRRRKNWGLRR